MPKVRIHDGAKGGRGAGVPKMRVRKKAGYQRCDRCHRKVRKVYHYGRSKYCLKCARELRIID